jgi:hypothetical protein
MRLQRLILSKLRVIIIQWGENVLRVMANGV